MKCLLLKMIRFYQITISFDHGFLKKVFNSQVCRFYPTCSEYAYQAIKKYGVFKGGAKGLKRLLRCHPWNSGGYDPLN